MQSNLRRQALLIAALAIAYAVVTTLVHNSYYQLLMTIIPIWATMGLSWNMLSGYSGLVSFGHAAFFGLGAYFVAIAQMRFGLSPWLGIPGAGLLGGMAGLLIGGLTFRLRGFYFALGMLAYPLALLAIFEWLGYQELALPMHREAPIAYMQFADHRIHAYLALALMLAAMVLSIMLERSRFGMSLLAIKQDESAAEAAGINTLMYKLKAITLSGALAGIAGGLYAVVLLIITPAAVFGMLVSAQALIITMFGGIGTVWGPVIGAVVLVPLGEFLHLAVGHVVPGIQGVVYGAAIILVIFVAPEGIFWKVKDLVVRRRARKLGPSSAANASGEPRATAVPKSIPNRPMEARPPLHDRPKVFEVCNVSKAFGGLMAVRNVSMTVHSGEIVGIIGPNGSGKTTFFNLINGFIPTDAGQIFLDGSNIVGKKPYEICAAGIGRTFQVVKPFRHMTVRENVAIGAYVHTASLSQARAVAEEALSAVGLSSDADVLAMELTNKQVRLLEIARALAGKPKVLLLDETLAGLGSVDANVVIGAVRRIAAQGITVIIIEHAMQTMVRLVDRFVVFDHGSVLAQGLPAEITKDPAVIDAYLGKSWRESGAQD